MKRNHSSRLPPSQMLHDVSLSTLNTSNMTIYKLMQTHKNLDANDISAFVDVRDVAFMHDERTCSWPVLHCHFGVLTMPRTF
ncbi:hypothetical protein V1522DRAFT_193695 [Lipomyces starkeyi]